MNPLIWWLLLSQVVYTYISDGQESNCFVFVGECYRKIIPWYLGSQKIHSMTLENMITFMFIGGHSFIHHPLGSVQTESKFYQRLLFKNGTALISEVFMNSGITVFQSSSTRLYTNSLMSRTIILPILLFTYGSISQIIK